MYKRLFSSLFSLSSLAVFIFPLLLALSCVQGGRQGLPRIDDFTVNSSNGGEFCQQATTEEAILDGNTSICNSNCPEGTEEGDESRIDDLVTEISESEVSDQTKDFLNQMISNASSICFEPLEARPDEAMEIEGGVCACLQGESDLVNDCAAFCSQKAETQKSTLYGSVDPDPDIELNEKFGDLHGWCTAVLAEAGQTSPACVLELWDGSASQTIEIETTSGSNNFQAVLEDTKVSYDKVYVARIKELSSGATSRGFHIQRHQVPDDTSADTPLKINPVSQYMCLNRTGDCGQTDGSDEFYECARRQYYYYPINDKPPAMPSGTNFTICHDTNQYGEEDSPQYPRLNLRPEQFAMWHYSDQRFVDQDGDNSPDVNDEIEQRLQNEFGVTQDVSLFGLFQWPSRPGASAANIGFYMQPWVDQDTGRAFCPGLEHYNSGQPLFKVLKELVGVETEGIYIARKEPIELNENGQPIPQLLLIREGLLEQIWFYFDNEGQIIEADDVAAANRTIHFYWPPEPDSPFQRKATQELYTIRSPEDIGSSDAASGLQTSLRPPDKRFGCIPAVE